MVRQSLLSSNVDDVGPQVDPDDKGEFTEAQLTANFVCKISLISPSHTVPNIGRYYNVSNMCCTRGGRKPRKKIPSRAKTYRRLWMQKATRRSMQMQCDMVTGLRVHSKSVSVGMREHVITYLPLPVRT